MLNKLNPLQRPNQETLLNRCQQEGDMDACRSLQYSNNNPIAPTTIGNKGVVGMAEGGPMETLLAPEEIGMVEDLTNQDPFLPIKEVVGEEAYMDLLQAMSDYPVVARVAEMAIKTGDGEVDGESGVDRVPANLTEGEFVFSAPAVQAIGVDKLEKLHEEAKQMAASSI